MNLENGEKNKSILNSESIKDKDLEFILNNIYDNNNTDQLKVDEIIDLMIIKLKSLNDDSPLFISYSECLSKLFKIKNDNNDTAMKIADALKDIIIFNKKIDKISDTNIFDPNKNLPPELRNQLLND